jgi:predicted dehydrogenase
MEKIGGYSIEIRRRRTEEKIMTEQHSVLMIGGGSIGERHVRCFLQTGRTRVALCEVNAAVRESVASRYDLSGVFADLESALGSKPDLAVICTPAHMHVAMAARLAEAAVHALIEKPLSTRLDGVEPLIERIRHRNLQAAVAYVYRAHPILGAMRETILDGRFGKPVQIVVVAGQHFPYYRPAYREIYYTSHATGGGAIQDALTHLVNAGEWLVGPITDLAADAAHQVLPGVEVEDTVHVIARHGPVLGSYSLNQHQAPNEVTITVVCERGTVRFEAHRQRWSWATQPEQPWQDAVFPPLERDTLFVRQAEAFLDQVEGKRPPLCSIEDSRQTLRVNLAILQAVQTRAWQTLTDEGTA